MSEASKSVNDIIRHCINMRTTKAHGSKGTATVFLIEEQAEIFLELFMKLKENGYSYDDITSMHRTMLINACMPKYKSGSEKEAWTFQSLKALTTAEIAVFGSVYSPDAPPVDPEQFEFYYNVFRSLMPYFEEKMESPKGKKQSKNKHKEESEQSEEKTETKDADDFDIDDEEEFFPHPEAKPFNPSAFKEPIPDTIEDDMSWLPKRGIK